MRAHPVPSCEIDSLETPANIDDHAERVTLTNSFESCMGHQLKIAKQKSIKTVHDNVNYRVDLQMLLSTSYKYRPTYFPNIRLQSITSYAKRTTLIRRGNPLTLLFHSPVLFFMKRPSL